MQAPQRAKQSGREPLSTFGPPASRNSPEALPIGQSDGWTRSHLQAFPFGIFRLGPNARKGSRIYRIADGRSGAAPATRRSSHEPVYSEWAPKRRRTTPADAQ